MKVIVVGNGNVGNSLIEQLQSEGHDITVIDKKISNLEDLNNKSDVLCINGDGINEAVLTEAGVKDSDLLIAVTSSDELNIVCCMLSKRLGVKNVVARIRGKEYAKQRDFIKRNLNIDYAINPELRTANEIANQFKFIGNFKIDTLSKGLVDVLSFRIEEGNKLIDLKLSEIYKNYSIKMLVCAVERENEVFVPSGDFKLEKGDMLHLISSNKEIPKIVGIIDSSEQITSNVVIVGGGKISYYLCNELIKMGLDIKVIDSDIHVCEELAELLPQVTIICGDATNQTLLEEEGILNTDAFVSLTGNDEINIILSLYAKTQNINKVITKVNQPTYLQLVKKIGLDNVFTPRDVITGSILKYVRSIKNKGQISADSVHRIVSNKVEALEFKINETFNYTDIPLKDLKLEKGIIIAGVVRDGQFIIADGNLSLKHFDTIIVIAIKKRITNLNDILGGN
ncbi:Trk system potassium transporter TrkA [Streptobacillus felis]|uniref:Trk system potassium transporter TrkA n=1 Tax=Streptobacillus felis TaxID=1384509 RepID=UPI00082B120A|nr:Trk system potassium transporter TrkA [Streptobacillus felis]